MASGGLTKLEAVNLALTAAGQGRVTALAGSSDTGDAGLAEWYLETTTREVLERGEDDVSIVREFTADGSGTVAVGAQTLRIEPIGKYEGRKFSIRDGEVYDRSEDTNTPFASAEKVWLRVVEEVNSDSTATAYFEDLAPVVKTKIAWESARRFVQDVRMSKERADAIAERSVQADISGEKYRNDAPSTDPPNVPSALTTGRDGGDRGERR